MSEAKFTPGPWYSFDNKSLNGTYWIGPSSFFSIAEVRNGAEDEEYGGDKAELANAHLIAAAPDLYEALEIAVANLRCATVCSDADEDDEEAIQLRDAWKRDIDRCREALSRARGEVNEDVSS